MSPLRMKAEDLGDMVRCVTDIVLTTHCARWIHAAFGLRYLRANLGELRARSAIVEFDLETRAADAAEVLLRHEPAIVGIGVYVWNATAARELVSMLRRLRPDLVLVLGGPEVSHELELQPWTGQADHVVRGEADLEFAALCRRLLAGERPPRVIDAPPPHFAAMAWPYDEYTATDVAHRVVYVEASRGCPFTCEFCLSALDDGVRAAPLQAFLLQMDGLWRRGVRSFKFVDRTFNLDLAAAAAILGFFRERCEPGLFVHFEMIPDRLPDRLRALIASFPAGVLQFEVGIQTFDPEVARRIARRQDATRIADNLAFLRDATGVHVHADLIVGLPGETLDGFGRGFDRLLALGPAEIQVGILKRLRGAPIARHDEEWQVVWSDEPPYEVLQTRALSFGELQRLKRFARYWDVVANSGRWRHTLELLLGDAPFANFLAFADWLFATTRATHGIQKHRLASLLFEHLGEVRAVARDTAGAALAADYAASARHDWPEFLRPWAGSNAAADGSPAAAMHRAAARQERHARARAASPVPPARPETGLPGTGGAASLPGAGTGS